MIPQDRSKRTGTSRHGIFAVLSAALLLGACQSAPYILPERITSEGPEKGLPVERSHFSAEFRFPRAEIEKAINSIKKPRPIHCGNKKDGWKYLSWLDWTTKYQLGMDGQITLSENTENETLIAVPMLSQRKYCAAGRSKKFDELFANGVIAPLLRTKMQWPNPEKRCEVTKNELNENGVAFNTWGRGVRACVSFSSIRVGKDWHLKIILPRVGLKVATFKKHLEAPACEINRPSFSLPELSTRPSALVARLFEILPETIAKIEKSRIGKRLLDPLIRAIGACQLNVGEKSKEFVSRKISEMEETLDPTLLMEKLWRDSLTRSIEVTPDLLASVQPAESKSKKSSTAIPPDNDLPVTLRLNPLRIYTSQPKFKNGGMTLTVGIEAKPRIIAGKITTEYKPTVPKLPNRDDWSNRLKGLQLNLPVALKYKFIAEALVGWSKNESRKPDGGKLKLKGFAVKIEKADVYLTRSGGEKSEKAIAVNIKLTAKSQNSGIREFLNSDGWMYLTGKPVPVSEGSAKALCIDDFNLHLDTDNKIVKTATDLVKNTHAFRVEIAKFLSVDLDKLNLSIESKLNEHLKESIDVTRKNDFPAYIQVEASALELSLMKKFGLYGDRLEWETSVKADAVEITVHSGTAPAPKNPKPPKEKWKIFDKKDVKENGFSTKKSRKLCQPYMPT